MTNTNTCAPVNPSICQHCGKQTPKNSRKQKLCIDCSAHRWGKSYYRILERLRQATLLKIQASWKCAECECDYNSAQSKPVSMGKKYCSMKCRVSKAIRHEKERLNANPILRQRKRESTNRAWAKRTLLGKNRAYKKQYHSRPEVRIAKSHRNRIQELIKKGALVKSRSSIKLFGCSVAFLMQYLQKQFRRGMSWNNYGMIWVVDHVIPCASFDLIKPEEQAKCFHFSNLQPLFRTENAIKSDRILPTQPQFLLPA